MIIWICSCVHLLLRFNSLHVSLVSWIFCLFLIYSSSMFHGKSSNDILLKSLYFIWMKMGFFSLSFLKVDFLEFWFQVDATSLLAHSNNIPQTDVSYCGWWDNLLVTALMLSFSLLIVIFRLVFDLLPFPLVFVNVL